MAVELWRWQNNNGSSDFHAAVALSDGSILVAGTESEDFVAIKLDTSGDILWKWKEGTSRSDKIFGAAEGSDGSVVLSGSTGGSWAETIQGMQDYAAVKLDSTGDVVWRLQRGSAGSDRFNAVAVGQDDSAFLGGCSSEDFSLIKVDADGDVLWEWTGDSGGEDIGYDVAMAGDDGSVVLAGLTSGNWSGTNAGGFDFAAVKVDADGQELWRWQDGTTGDDKFFSVVANEDGSILLGGKSYGINPFYTGDTPSGSSDAIALRLDADGTLVWGFQGGTVTFECVLDLALRDDGSVSFAGYTFGNWNAVNQGMSDFMVGKLNATDGSLQPWRWQDGTSQVETVRAIAPVGSEGSMALVGKTRGSFGASNIDEVRQGIIVLVTNEPSTPAPERAPTSAPRTAPTPAPTQGSTAAPIPLPTLLPTPPSPAGISSPAPVPTPATGATGAPLPASTVTTLAPSRLGVSTFTPIPTPSSALIPSPIPTPPVGPTPTVSTSPLAGPSGSSSSTIVMATVVPTAIVLVLLVLILLRRTIYERLSPRRFKIKPVALAGNINDPGSPSGPMTSGGSGVDEVVSGQQTSLGSSGAPASPRVMPHSDNVPSGHGGRTAAAFSQEPSATVASQSRSSIEPTVPPPGDGDVMRGCMMGLPSPGVRK